MQISSVTDVTSLMKTAESALGVAVKTAKIAIDAEKAAGGLITDIVQASKTVAKAVPLIGSIIDIIA